jgi:dihydroorotate dehydrogenase electron transfer subunit
VPVVAGGDGNERDHVAPSNAGRCRTHVTTEDGSCGEQGLVTDRLAILLETGQANAVFACGPHGMLAAIARLCRRHGVPCQLSWEAYMRCGIGICGACEHEGKLLCLDGPVLHDSHHADAPVDT